MMQLNTLKPGQTVKTKHMIAQARVQNWRYARECASVGGGIMPNTELKVAQVQATAPHFAVLELPGRSPPAFLKVSGEELAMNFTVQAAAAKAPARPPNLAETFRKLSQRQSVVKDGLDVIRDARAQLAKDMASARFWSNVDVLANAALLPLNIIVNAFEVKAAVSIYQAVVKEAYKQYAQSGTRVDNAYIKKGLGALKTAVVETLKKKGMTQYVPGVNILMGVAEDTTALIEAASRQAEGSREMQGLMRQVDAKLAAAYQEYVRIGVEMDRLLTEIDRRQRTA